MENTSGKDIICQLQEHIDALERENLKLKNQLRVLQDELMKHVSLSGVESKLTQSTSGKDGEGDIDNILEMSHDIIAKLKALIPTRNH